MCKKPYDDSLFMKLGKNIWKNKKIFDNVNFKICEPLYNNLSQTLNLKIK